MEAAIDNFTKEEVDGDSRRSMGQKVSPSPSA